MEYKQFQQIKLEDKSQKLKYRFHSKKKSNKGEEERER